MKRMDEMSRLKLMVCMGFAVIFAVLIALSLSLKAFGKEKVELNEKYYSVLENAMKENVKDYLNNNGYTNSGIMITHSVDGEGYRKYTVTVHHGRIDRMEESERSELSRKLSEFDFEADNCGFEHKFLLE